MSTEAILDALATKAGAVTGIKKAYGSGASDSTVAVLPDSIADGPVAVVTYDGTTVLNQGEDLEHRFVIRVYVTDQGSGAAFKALLPFVTRFAVALRSDKDLGGTCSFTTFEGVDPPESVDLSGRMFLVLPLRLTAREVDFSAVITL